MNTTTQSVSNRLMPPEELALQSLCKRLFKSRLFRGHYEERRYVEDLADYRDIVILQRGERELEKLLLDTKEKLQIFYHRFVPNMWVGISKGRMDGNSKQLTTRAGLLDTCIWAELNDVAFGEYWFSIKSLRFRDYEVLFKLKMVRAVEAEPDSLRARRNVMLNNESLSTLALTAAPQRTRMADISATTLAEAENNENDDSSMTQEEIGLADFLVVLCQWGESIKHTTYNFLANDVNKENIVKSLKFLVLVILSLLSGATYALRFIGIFTLRFMFEFCRFTKVSTPIIIKIIDVVNKVIGGFYILLAMVWKDAVVNRGATQKQALPALKYHRGSQFRSMDYSIPGSFPAADSDRKRSSRNRYSVDSNIQ